MFLYPNKDLNQLTTEMKERVDAWMELCKKVDIAILITEGRRSVSRQRFLYAFGRFGINKSKLKVTWTLKSNHITGNAIDFGFLNNGVFSYNGDWQTAFDLAESVGLKSLFREYGTDKPHLEFNFDFQGKNLYAIVENTIILKRRMDTVNEKLVDANAAKKYLAQLKGVKYIPYKIV